MCTGETCRIHIEFSCYLWYFLCALINENISNFKSTNGIIQNDIRKNFFLY